MNIKQPSDQETYLGLKSKDNKAYEILYKFYYPSVRNFITKNNGSEDDAKDVFQETILVLLEKVPKNDFNLTSSLKTYIFAISWIFSSNIGHPFSFILGQSFSSKIGQSFSF
ncbi:MAG: sigma-70 family RNA polymerase sigma factor [Bacteroidetes bacterium]|nr:sigma-70 family RNA polymerase sigma factor [Bacteroidota bacterium]